VARVLAVVADLMLSSRVSESLGAAGHEVTVAASVPAELPEGVELIVADLEADGPDGLVGGGVPVLGFYSHVEVETRRAAEEAGVDLVVPRSRMARELPQLVEGLLGQPSP
jgi:hypothetical protein